MLKTQVILSVRGKSCQLRNVQSYRRAHLWVISIAKVKTLTSSLRLGFDLLTSGSVQAEVLPWTICILTFEAVFLIGCGQTDRQRRLNVIPHVGGYTAGVGNENCSLFYLLC